MSELPVKYCPFSQAAGFFAERQAEFTTSKQADRILTQLGKYNAGKNEYIPYPPPGWDRDNSQLLLLIHRSNDYENILRQLRENGELEFYDPSSLRVIRDNEIPDPFVDVGIVAKQIIEFDKNKPRKPAPAEIATPGAKLGITKNAVINAFDGLHFKRDKWSKYLGDPPNWLKDCRVTPGKKGRRVSATWDPVLIATALFDKKEPIRKLDAVFDDLKNWKDEWQEASTSFRD